MTDSVPAPAHLIDHQALSARLGDRSFTLVDVLPLESYAEAHIPGAVNLPLATLAERAASALPDRAQEIVVYCAAFT
jgi:rhodanese-related sulfurtransferase